MAAKHDGARASANTWVTKQALARAKGGGKHAPAFKHRHVVPVKRTVPAPAPPPPDVAMTETERDD
ncbi:MAG: hypothetical protein KC657_13405 [Myxococcales bacterium]|nr:hypothetical protein [Myxococcales bacterium]